MSHDEGTLATSWSVSIYYQRWLPSDEPEAILLVAHGLAEHSGRYEHFARFFTARGHAVVALDHQGHGRSDGMRCHIDRFSEFSEGVALLLDKAGQDFPSIPIYLVGHSMGGLISVHVLLEQQHDFAGCIVSGAAVQPAVELSSIQRFSMRLFSHLLPKLRVLQLDASQVSRDPGVVERYRNDPLVFTGKVTARLLGQLFSAMQGLDGKLSEIEIPMLILHGECDGLALPDGSRMLYEKIGSRDKRLIVYDGLYHEVYNEPEQEQVMTDVADWLAERL
jgi:alpha-beta hydrolase superfamily lysophospholipase